MVYVETVILCKTFAKQEENPPYSASLCSFSFLLTLPTVLPCICYLQMSDIHPFGVYAQ